MKKHKIITLTFFCFMIMLQVTAQLPKVVSGSIERHAHFNSQYITARNIDVWLPHNYSTNKKYAVLYMHDGQMLFDPATTWNHQAWNIDDVATKLFSTNKIKEFIVVGIWNGGITRHTDYFPQKPFESLTNIEKDTITAQLQRANRIKENFIPQSNNYLLFITKELMPFIQSKYAIDTARENTFIAGSSMGGLISIYALCEYPNLFGGAACLSTHWPGTFTIENNFFIPAMFNYLKTHLPTKNKHKIYFDCGNKTLDALYPALQKQVDAIMKEKRFSKKFWITKYFNGENHTENAWNKRLHIPLQFLFAN